MKKVGYGISFLVPVVIWAILAYATKVNLSIGFMGGALFWGTFIIAEMVVLGAILGYTKK